MKRISHLILDLIIGFCSSIYLSFYYFIHDLHNPIVLKEINKGFNDNPDWAGGDFRNGKCSMQGLSYREIYKYRKKNHTEENHHKLRF